MNHGDTQAQRRTDSSGLSAVIVAAGSSRRMGFDKLTAPLAGRPLIAHSLAAFEACADVDAIVLVCSGERVGEFEAVAREFPKVRRVVEGGKERAGSVLRGVTAFQHPHSGFVAVHDGARPLITPAAITTCYRAALDAGAAACAEPLADTLHRADPGRLAVETVPRENLWRMQTPQILRFGVLESLLRTCASGATDEVSLLIQSGAHAKVVDIGAWNLKVTYPRDLELAEMILTNRLNA